MTYLRKNIRCAIIPLFLSTNLVEKICHDLGGGGLTRASLGPYSDQGRFLFRRKGMSVKVMGIVWDSNLKPTDKFVLIAYADHASHDGTNVFPSIETIVKKTGFSERTVQGATRKLEEIGWLISDGKGKNGTNRWRIPVDIGGAAPAPPLDEGCILPREGVQLTAGGGAAPAPEPSLTIIKPSEGRQKHPPNHPSIKLFRKVMGKWPDKEDGRPMIIDAIGEDTKRLASWEQHLIDWKLAGYNRLNIAGIVDAFLAGGLRGYGEEAPVKNKTREFLDELREGKDV